MGMPDEWKCTIILRMRKIFRKTKNMGTIAFFECLLHDRSHAAAALMSRLFSPTRQEEGQ